VTKTNPPNLSLSHSKRRVPGRREEGGEEEGHHLSDGKGPRVYTGKGKGPKGPSGEKPLSHPKDTGQGAEGGGGGGNFWRVRGWAPRER